MCNLEVSCQLPLANRSSRLQKSLLPIAIPWCKALVWLSGFCLFVCCVFCFVFVCVYIFFFYFILSYFDLKLSFSLWFGAVCQFVACLCGIVSLAAC